MIFTFSYSFSMSFVPLYSGIQILISPVTINLHLSYSSNTSLSIPCSNFLSTNELAKNPITTNRMTTVRSVFLFTPCSSKPRILSLLLNVKANEDSYTLESIAYALILLRYCMFWPANSTRRVVYSEAIDDLIAYKVIAAY